MSARFYFRQSKQITTNGNFRSYFDVFQDFMPVLVICNFYHDPCKNTDCVRYNVNYCFFDYQGQVTQVIVSVQPYCESSEILCLSRYMAISKYLEKKQQQQQKKKKKKKKKTNKQKKKKKTKVPRPIKLSFSSLNLYKSLVGMATTVCSPSAPKP